MKLQLLKIPIMLLILAGSLYSCEKRPEPEENGEPKEVEIFYYDLGEKIFIEQVKDKILLKFTPNASEEQLSALIGSDASLQPTTDIFLDKNAGLRFAVLEAKDGKQIPSAVIESFKAKLEVVSVEYLYQQNEFLQGLTDMFVVELKETTTYAQLQELAEQNHCIIGEENRYAKNQFKLFVSKTSELNAIQTANLFFETELFEFATPSLNILNLGIFIPSNEFYYYVSGEKIFLEQVKDKILLQFTPDATKEQFLISISSDVSLQTMPPRLNWGEYFTEGRYDNIVFLESKDGSHILLATIESFKARKEVAWAGYMYLYNSQLQGIYNFCVVKLKESVTYAQLQGLAEQHHCTIGERNKFVKNNFTLYVSKTSKLDAMQTSNLFYETSLFEYAFPRSVRILDDINAIN